MFENILTNFHLEKILWIIKSKLKYMILIGLIGAVLGAGYSMVAGADIYQAQISFYVYSNPDYVTDTGINQSSSDITQASSLLPSYMQILNSNSFLNKVISELELQEYYTPEILRKKIRANSVSGTSVFKVSVYDYSPVIAMNIANEIGELAPDEIIRIVKSGGIGVLDQAELPTEPYESTGTLKYTILGFGGMFVLAFIFCLCKGLMNTTIRRKYEIESLFTIPIIGDVPYKLPIDKKKEVDIRLTRKSDFSWKEAYSNIRVSVLFAKREEKCPIFAITSADCGEGKTVSSLNIASSYAQLGKKVLIIDADFRNSGMAAAVNMKDPKDGLTAYLSEFTNNLEIFELDENLDVILSGALPENPSELLTSDRWYNLLKGYQEEYDAIFVDLPALAIVSDALSMAQMATAYLIVVRAEKTKFDRLEMIIRKLEAVDANICGFIYNCISTKSPDYSLKLYGKEYKNRAEQGIHPQEISKNKSKRK